MVSMGLRSSSSIHNKESNPPGSEHSRRASDGNRPGEGARKDKDNKVEMDNLSSIPPIHVLRSSSSSRRFINLDLPCRHQHRLHHPG